MQKFVLTRSDILTNYQYNFNFLIYQIIEIWAARDATASRDERHLSSLTFTSEDQANVHRRK